MWHHLVWERGNSTQHIHQTTPLNGLCLRHFITTVNIQSAFEIALVRDKWLFKRTSKQSVSSYPSDKWKFTTIFYVSLYNAVIERQNTRDFTLENRQRSRSFATRCHKNNTGLHCRCPQTFAYLLCLYWWRRHNLSDLCNGLTFGKSGKTGKTNKWQLPRKTCLYSESWRIQLEQTVL